MPFLHKSQCVLLVLRTTRQYFSSVLRDHFKEQNHQQNPQTCENVTLKRLWNNTLTRGGWKQEGRVCPCSASAGNVHRTTGLFHCPAHMHECRWKRHKCGFLGVNNFSEYANSQIWNPQIRIVCIRKKDMLVSNGSFLLDIIKSQHRACSVIQYT